MVSKGLKGALSKILFGIGTFSYGNTNFCRFSGGFSTVIVEAREKRR
jgi:hypothetical protein